MPSNSRILILLLASDVVPMGASDQPVIECGYYLSGRGLQPSLSLGSTTADDPTESERGRRIARRAARLYRTRPHPRRRRQQGALRPRLDPPLPTRSASRGAARRRRTSSTAGALRQRPPAGAGALGRTHRFERRCGRLSRRTGRLAGADEPDFGFRSGGSQRHLSGRGHHRGFTDLRPRAGFVLSG